VLLLGGPRLPCILYQNSPPPFFGFAQQTNKSASTVNKRQFGIEDDQIVLYTTIMYVLRGQLMDHSDRSIGCLDYDHLAEEPVRRPDMKRLLALFGIEERAVRDTYRPPAATNSTMSPSLQIYMDTYVETSRAVWETCTAVSHNGWFN
jgi:hypothetical protein